MYPQGVWFVKREKEKIPPEREVEVLSEREKFMKIGFV